MKAIIKMTGEIVDVEVRGWDANNNPISYHHNYTKFYNPEDLEIVGDISNDSNIGKLYRTMGTYKGEKVQICDNISCIENAQYEKLATEKTYPELMPITIESYFKFYH